MRTIFLLIQVQLQTHHFNTSTYGHKVDTVWYIIFFSFSIVGDVGDKAMLRLPHVLAYSSAFAAASLAIAPDIMFSALIFSSISFFLASVMALDFIMPCTRASSFST